MTINAPDTVWQIHEDAIGTEEALGISREQGIELVGDGLLIPRMVIYEFELAPGADPNEVRARLGL